MPERITSMPRTELVQLGQRIRAPYLLQQAGVTIPQARAVGDAMLKLMRAGLLDDVENVRQAVAKAYEDKTVMAEEAKLSTGSQQMAMRAGKQWCRAATARATAASLAGVRLPETMCLVPDARTVPARISQMQGLLGMLEQHAPAMDKVGAPTQPLIDEGRGALEALIAADSGQELKRAADVPASLANFYALKAELYIGLKMINEAAREYYANDLPSASRFNLSLLYRKTGSTTAEPAPVPATPASASAAAPTSAPSAR